MSEKIWHPNFMKYMDDIVRHKNYSGLPIEKRNDGTYAWIATKKSKIGQARIQWALNKAHQLGIPNEAGVYAKVMYEVHPTKEKVCQICGKTMSIRYIYPNKNFINYLNKNYGYKNNVFDSIHDVNYFLAKQGLSEAEIKKIYIKRLKFPPNKQNLPLNKLMDEVELHCRSGNSKLCGPGAMSNFPDRYDGFHTYNRCCRSVQDTGRHADNMKTYTKDRRAYEYWSDGNIHAANKFMGSSFFKGASADHIGPISLGFIHDSRFLQPMASGDNSAKRDRLVMEDFIILQEKEKEHNICPVSWYAKLIWEQMKKEKNIDLEKYRTLLKINMNNFMYCLFLIIENTGKNGKLFLENFYLKPKMNDFMYDYNFNPDGTFKRSKRNITDSTNKEYSRFKRIAFESIYDYQDKENRNIKNTSFKSINNDLKKLYQGIKADPHDINNKCLFESIIEILEKELF
ncbi:Type II restriction endonuclease [Clostridium liquoris]|uniref:Type II restriction endonuclease n=1 Tax=Clostridium liquoris TaxID=1289519 RepID=A0A2T0B5W6_9CLOT|nr:Alw26I/Eco31I/Esp3I family type II restriction endonuclease [Clostridium liquoris]PRR79262.1 Type II restriction endonuclease [Clostridium liquoris]